MKYIALAFVAMIMAGCSLTREYPELETSVNHFDQEYKIGIGDTLNVSVWRNADLSISVPVRPDGRISTPLVGDIQAAGLTAVELAEAIKKDLEDYVRTPQVTVIVTSPVSAEYLHRIRVTGAVGSPQSVPYRKGMTVMDAVLIAGGPSAFAAANKAKLHRGDKVYPIYVDDILTEGDLRSNYELMPSDIIAVPESAF